MTWLPHHAMRALSDSVVDAQIAVRFLRGASALVDLGEAFERATDRAMARVTTAHGPEATLRGLDELCLALAQCVQRVEEAHRGQPTGRAERHAWFELAHAYQQACYQRWLHGSEARFDGAPLSARIVNPREAPRPTSRVEEPCPSPSPSPSARSSPRPPSSSSRWSPTLP